MKYKSQLQKLATEKNSPCVTISLNTHQTHPDNEQDEILLKNMLKEAEERLISEFGKREVTSLLQNIDKVGKEIDANYNLDSLHIFLSNDTKEIVNLLGLRVIRGTHFEWFCNTLFNKLIFSK